jgi:hypothetical protein
VYICRCRVLLVGTDTCTYSAGAVYRSTSFYVQKVKPSCALHPFAFLIFCLQLFSLNRGDEYLPSTLPNSSGTLFWSVTRKTSPSEVIIKVRNLLAITATYRSDDLHHKRYQTLWARRRACNLTCRSLCRRKARRRSWPAHRLQATRPRIRTSSCRRQAASRRGRPSRTQRPVSVSMCSLYPSLRAIEWLWRRRLDASNERESKFYDRRTNMHVCIERDVSDLLRGKPTLLLVTVRLLVCCYRAITGKI